MTYEEETNKALENKKIVKADITGGGVYLKLDDGTVLDYQSSDGGWSCWDIMKEGGVE